MLYIIAIVLAVTVIIGPSLWVKRTLARYGQPQDRYQGTGGELAEHLLAEEGITGVKVERIEQPADHYDPIEKAVRLSPDVFDQRSLTAITVAAHEVGHAVQHYTGYRPLMMRTRLVQIVAPLERIGAGLLFLAPVIGIATRAPAPIMLTVLAGFMVLGSSIVVHMLTLPMEIDASFSRALPMLKKHKILFEADQPHARKILRAAAGTYAAAAIVSLFNVARWWAILRR